MNAPVIDLTRRETAAAERDRLDAFLTAIEELGPAREGWEAIRDEDVLNDEGWEALERLHDLEGKLLALALQPDLSAFLVCIRDQLAEIAEGRP